MDQESFALMPLSPVPRFETGYSPFTPAGLCGALWIKIAKLQQ